MSYRIFTIEAGVVNEGAKIETLHLKGAGIDISAVLVGEEGRGRRQEAVHVDRPPMVPCTDRNKEVYETGEKCQKCGAQLGSLTKGQWSETRKHPDQGMVVGTLKFAEIGQTKAGKPKFFTKDAPTTDEKIVVVFRTHIGFRGGNEHTGDRKRGWYTLEYYYREAAEQAGVPIQETYTAEEVKGYSPRIMQVKYPDDKTSDRVWNAGFELHREFEPFPGQKLVSGMIAEGDAGRMGSGEQLIAVMPKGVVFRTSYSGRLYGKPGAHYYMWTGEKLIAATWEERCAADLF